MPLEFGILLPTGSQPNQPPQSFLQDIHTFTEHVRGHIHSLWMTDHFFWGNNPTFEAWTVISYLAAMLPDFQVGTLVLGQGYRNPALLAKMGATLQALSGGRLLLGLGAGWKEDEYHAYGYDFPLADARISQLEEAIIIIKRLWYDADPVSYFGRSYRIKDAYCQPKPNPIPPIMVGGGGRKTLRVAAQHANWWNFSAETPQLYQQRLAILQEHCNYVGRNPADIRLTWLGKMMLAIDKRTAKKLDSSILLAGTAEQIAEKIAPFVELGIDYFIFELPQSTDPDFTACLIEAVLPRIRALVS